MRWKFNSQKTIKILYRPPNRTKHLYIYFPNLKFFLKELIELGIIRPSKSPFCSPCLMVPKPHQESVAACDLKYRMCVSLKDINALTVRQHHRIPNIQSIWATLGQAKFLSCIDLAHGFWQMSNCSTDGSIEKTAFSTEFGHFEFVGCCMGAKNTLHTFNLELRPVLKDTICLMYLWFIMRLPILYLVVIHNDNVLARI